MTIDEALQLALQRHQAGQFAEAEDICRQIVAHQPNCPDAYRLLSVLAHRAGRLDAAVEMMRRAAALAPDRAECQFDLAHLLVATGLMDEAISGLRRAVALQPGWSAAHNRLGNALYATGDVEQAVVAYRQAIAAKGDNADAHNNLGVALCALGRIDEGIAAYREALRARRDFPDAWFNCANACKTVGRLDEAVDCFSQAVALRPAWPQAHNGLGLTLMWRGEIEAAVARFNEALAVAPNDVVADSNRVFALQFHPGYDGPAILREHSAWNQRHVRGMARAGRAGGAGDDGGEGRRLRIGYVSPNFCGHSQAPFIHPLFKFHDHGPFEIYCYADVLRPDAMTQELIDCADAWQFTAQLDDAAMAQKIRNDKIDILVDLTMHMAQGRPLVFAAKSAPVQVAWLAYPGTSGLAAMDYRLSDKYLDPPGVGDDCYIEKTVRLPDTFACFDPTAMEGESPLAAPAAERNGYVTLGCLNNFCKINSGVLKLWSGVLINTPRSRLRLLAPEGKARRWVADTLEQHGVEAARIEFVSAQPRAGYLAEFQRIDIGLDTLPYNGHTTSLESCWQGVPLVTRVGGRAAGRAGWSVLNNLGLTELAAHSDEEFVQVASELAADLPRLMELRKTMRARMRASPLTDARSFARNVEAAYHGMWKGLGS